MEDKQIVSCNQCILTSKEDPNLVLDEKGICNYCHLYLDEVKLQIKTGKEGEDLLNNTIAKIKDYAKNKKYDCLIGISGGVDSSYVAYLAHKAGLRALCVHFDNGWNSELAVANIENIVSKLGFDLYTYVINWEEFKDLQLAYLKASVVDIEVLSDHAIHAAMFKIAKQNDIRYVLGGHNVVTEGILPYHWTYKKHDYVNIKSIHKKYGTVRLKTYPFLNRQMKSFIKNSGLEFVNYLNWVPYIKDDVKLLLQKKLNWKDYGGKHYESIWTRFYQGYILPVKFGIDKRTAHLSALICSGQITRQAALEQMKEKPYDPALQEQDLHFVLKKLGLSREEWETIMNTAPKSHKDFDVEGSLMHYYPFLKPIKPLWNLVKKITGYSYKNHV